MKRVSLCLIFLVSNLLSSQNFTEEEKVELGRIIAQLILLHCMRYSKHTVVV